MTGETDASRSKVARARKKLLSVQAMQADYLREAADYRKVQHQNWTYYIGFTKFDPPEDIAFEAVEAVQHLRGALDKVAVEMVRRNNNGEANVGFPFWRKNGEDKDGRFKKLRAKLTDDQWSVIVKAAPFQEGNEALWLINEIANADKHRSGLVTAKPSMANQVSGFGDGHISMVNLPIGMDHLLADAGRETVLLGIQDGGTMGVSMQVSLRMMFQAPAQGYELSRLVNRQIEIVESLLDEVEARVFL